MVAVISGSGLGMFGSTVATLGGIGGSGNAAPGRGNDRVYVNSATGNLVVQSIDDSLAALGLDVSLVRTYNSQGLMDDDNGDNWRLGVHQRLYNLTGAVNTAGTRITKVFGDGREVTYDFDAALGSYVSTEGEGAHDTLTFASNSWVWEEGSSQVQEIYDENGRLTSSRDTDGNEVTYHYTGSFLTRIDDASGQSTHLDYTGNNLAGIRVVSNGVTQTLTTYQYDSNSRLSSVTVDLTPETTADAQVYVTSYTYDGDSRRIASITQTDGSSISFTYELASGQYRVRTYTDAMQRVTTLTYTSSGGGSSQTVNADPGELSTTRTETTTTTHDLNGSVVVPGAPVWGAPDNTTSGETDPQSGFVQYDANGNAFEIGYTSAAISVRRYDAATATWSVWEALISPPAEFDLMPLAIDDVGNAVLAWVDDVDIVHMSRYSSSAGHWSSSEVLDASAGSKSVCAVTVNNGHVAIAWQFADSGVLMTAVSTASGMVVEQLTATPLSSCSLSIDASGNATAVWSEQSGVCARQYSATAGTWSASQLVLPGTQPALFPIGGVGRTPSGDALLLVGQLMFDPQTGVVVEWHSSTYNAASDSWSQPTLVPLPQQVGLLKFDAQGNALLLGMGDDEQPGISLTLYDADSGTWGSTKTVALTTEQLQGMYGAAAYDLRGDSACFAWVDDGAGYLNIVTVTDGGPAVLTQQQVPIGSSAYPSGVTVAPDGSVDLTWTRSEIVEEQLVVTRTHRRFEPAGLSYSVPADATWQSLANTLYGVNSAAAGAALQLVLSNPTLSTGLQLTGLPSTLTVESTTNVTVPPYYSVQVGDTWASITQAIYGTSDEAAVSALQEQLGNPVLAVGLELTVPMALSFGGSATGELQTDVEDALGLVTTYTHDSSGRLATVLSPVVDGSRIETRYAYDAAGNLTSITQDPSGLNRVTTSEYDANGNLTLTRDSAGNTITRTYDSNNQLLTQTRYVGRDLDSAGSGEPTEPKTTRYVYDAESHLRFVISPEGRVTERQYDGEGRVTLTRTFTAAEYSASNFTESDLAAWAGTVDRSHLELAVYAYDFRGNVSSVTRYSDTTSAGAPLGTPVVSRFVYDQRGQLLQTIDPRGEATTGNPNDYRTAYTYDGLGRLLTTNEWISSTTTRTTLNAYDDAGRTTRSTFANGLVTTRVYNRAGELLSVANGSAGSFEALGKTSYAYDAGGRLQMVTDPAGARQFFYYDDADRLVAQIDGDGSLTEFVYNRAGERIKTIEYAALLSSTTRATLIDGSNNPTNVALSTLRAAAGGNAADDRITRSVYDASGALVYTIDPSGAVIENRYDGAGRLTDVIQYANRVTIARSVDQVLPSAVTVVTHADDRRTRYFYDGEGLKIGQLDAEGYLTAYAYTGGGRLADETRYANQAASDLRANGTLAALKSSVGTDVETVLDPERDQVTNYFYDSKGRLTGVLDAEGYLTEIQYDLASNVSKRIRYDQVLPYRSTLSTLKTLLTSGAIRETTEYTYDGAGKVISEIFSRGTATLTGSATTTYTYDTAGNLASSTRASGTGDARTTEARYDFLGRVVQELSAEGRQQITSGMTPAQIENIWTRWGISYAYDTAGRRISATRSPHDLPSPPHEPGTPQLEVTRYYYDEDGRLRFEINHLGERKEYRYNALGQLSEQIGYANVLTTAQMTGLTGGALTASLISTFTGNTSPTRDSLTTYQYSLTGKVSSVRTAVTTITAQDRLTTYTYNAFGENDVKFEVIDATRTLRTDYSYDKRGQLTLTRWDNVANGFNTNEARSYDSFGRLRTVTDARTNVISRYEYDRLGRRTAVVDSNIADRTVTEYDAFNRLFRVHDPFGNVTSYSYDEVNRSATLTTPQNIVVVTKYNLHGQVLEVTAAGRTTAYTYDRDGQVTQVSDNGGLIESRAYDRSGRQVTATDGNGIVTRFEYDAADRVLKRFEDNAGLQLTTTYTYDGMGRITRVVEPSGRRTDSTHFRDGSIEQTTVDPTGSEPIKTRYTYDRQGRVLTVTEGADSNNPRVTEYRYDMLGRRTLEIIDPGTGNNPVTNRPYLNLQTQFNYDLNGNLTRKIDGEGNSTWYVYDADNRRTHTIDALGGVTYTEYDYEDRVVEVKRFATALSASTMGLLAERNVVTTADFVAIENAASDRRTQSVYDRDGRERFTIDSLGGVTERTFDDNGNVTRERSYATRIAPTAYRTISQVTGALGTTNLEIIQPEDRVRWTAYNLRGQATFSVDGSGAVVRFTYDSVGNIKSRTEYATRISTSASMADDALRIWSEQAHITNDDNRLTRYWYDSTGRVRFTQDAEGYLTERRYADASREEREIVYVNKATIGANATTLDIATAIVNGSIQVDTDRDQITSTKFDAAGRVYQIWDANNNYEEFLYDAAGNKRSYRNQSGNIWNYVHDANGRLLEERSPPVRVTRLNDTVGDLSVSSSQPRIIVTKMQYDDLGNVISRIEGILRDTNGANEDVTQARETKYEYDQLGRQRLTIFPRVKTYYAAGDSNVFGAAGAVSRADTMTELRSEVFYDALGNAYRRDDVAIDLEHSNREPIRRTSYKLYDRLGRVTHDIDAMRYVTSYAYDTFGNQTQLTRHAAAITAPLPTSGVSAITVASDVNVDRTIETKYDRLNRVTSVTHPASYVYNAASGPDYMSGAAGVQGATTHYQYNAFGDVELERRLIIDTTYADTYSYYDRMGRRTAQIDAEGYLTTYQYDESGDLTGQVEYERRIETAFNTEGYTPPAASAKDRRTIYVYDELNRLKQESLSITFSSFASANEGAALQGGLTGWDVTDYDYDAVGNRTKVTVNGAETRTYYDELGRIRGVIAPLRNRGDDVQVRPVTATDYDAFGNAVRVIQYANGVSSLDDTNFIVNTSSLDRTTLIAYDSHSRVTHTEDAMGAQRYASYTERGLLAKEWQPVTNIEGATEFIVTVYGYDELGRQTSVSEPQSFGGQDGTVIVVRGSQYNAFGEVTSKSVNGTTIEYFHYDHAGRVWKTNSGDGIYKLFLYNLAGQATVEVRSQSADLATKTLGELQASLPGVVQMRTETVYDKLGRVLEKRDVTFETASTLQPSTASFNLSKLQDGRTFLYWTTLATNETAELRFRLRSTQGAPEQPWTVVTQFELTAPAQGYDVSALNGNYEFEVRFTRDETSTPYSIHTGTFSLGRDYPSNRVTVSSNQPVVAQNVTGSANGSSITLRWPPRASATEARLEIWLGGQWVPSTASIVNGQWQATLSGLTADGQYSYQITEYANGQTLVSSSGLLYKQGSTIITQLSGHAPHERGAPGDVFATVAGTQVHTITARLNWSTHSDEHYYYVEVTYTLPGETTPRYLNSGSITTNSWNFSGLQLQQGVNYSFIVRSLHPSPEEGVYYADTRARGTFTVQSDGQISMSLSSGSATTSDRVVTSGSTNVQLNWELGGSGYYKFSYRSPGASEWIPYGNGSQATLTLAPGASYDIRIQQGYDISAEESGGTPGFQTISYFEGVLSMQNGQPTVTPLIATASNLANISASNGKLSWSQLTLQSGDYVDFELYNLSNNPPTISRHLAQLNNLGGGNYEIDFSNVPGAAGGTPYLYLINYYRPSPNGPVVYMIGSGHVRVNKSAGQGVASILSTNAPGPISSFGQVQSGNQIVLGWSQPTDYSGSDTISFRYRNPSSGQWSEKVNLSGHSINLSSVLPPAQGNMDYVYELTYTRSGAQSAYRAASGVLAIREAQVVVGPLMDTTMSALEPTDVTPRFVQSVDRWGNVLTYKDAVDQITTYQYNERDQVTEVKQPRVRVVSTANGTVTATDNAETFARNYYNREGLLIATLDPNGNRNRMTYNAAGELISEQRSDATLIGDTPSDPRSYVYNNFGEKIQITDELGYRTRMRYDGAGRLVAMAREAEVSAFNSIDSDSNGAVDGNAIVQNFEYATLAINVVSNRYKYDQAGRRISETTGEIMDMGGSDETIRYWYDLQGNLIRRRLPMGGEAYDPDRYDTTYAYDLYGNGKKIRETDAIGGTQSWYYNAFGRLQTHTDIHGEAGGQSDADVVTYDYNFAGMLTRLTSSHGRDISYEYDNAGHLTRILEESIAESSSLGLDDVRRESVFAYDKAGRRTREMVKLGNTVFQDTVATYDTLGRLSTLSDALYTTKYEYDAAGNRTHIETYYDEPNTGHNGLAHDDLWYTYDGANRVRISQGVRSGNSVGIDLDRTIELKYNAAGQRSESTQFGETFVVQQHWDGDLNQYVDILVPVAGRYTLTYGYDGLGRLTSQTRDAQSTVSGVEELSDVRVYDRASRLTYQEVTFYEGWATRTRNIGTNYDDNGRMEVQTNSVEETNEQTTVVYGESVFDNGRWSRGFDAAGNLRGYDVYASNVPGTIHHSISYRSGDSYLETTHKSRIGQAAEGGETTRGYNLNGELVRVVDDIDATRNRYFANNADGRAIKAVQGPYGASSVEALADRTHARKPQLQLMFNGQQVGTLTSTGTNNRFYIPNFDVNYTPVADNYPPQAPAQVVVQEGDTLRTIAARVWGDGNLWYLIADENGMQDAPDDALTSGKMLQIPNEVLTLSNTSTSFKPFDAQQVIGDTTPAQPAPPAPRSGGGCGVLGQILILVVAIVVTIYTAGALAGGTSAALAGGGTATSVAGAGTAALSGGLAGGASLGTIGIAATAGAVGSVVSQGVAIAIGQQDGFDWNGVALGAIGAGVTAGLGGSSVWGDVLKNAGRAAPVLNGAANSALSQGIGVVTGVREHFSWRDVALSSIAAPISGAVGGKLQDVLGGGFPGYLAAGAVGSVVRQAFGGKVELSTVVADAFGNALGNSIVDGMSSQSATLAQASGGSADELQEVGITARYIGPGMEAANARLDNNPVNPIYQAGALRTPDEARAAEAVAASPSGVIETVVSTAPQWRPGEMLIYQDLMTAALIRGEDFNKDYASAQAQDAYRANMRSQADNFLIDTFSPYGHGKNAAVGLINLGIKAYGGLRGLEALRDGADMQTAAAVVEGFNSLQIDADAPFAAMMGSSLAPMVNDVRAWSENTFGIGGSTVLGAAGEFALDALALVGTGAAARRFVPELDITLGADARLLRIGGQQANRFEALAAEMRLNSSDLGMGVERASSELIEAIAARRTVVYAQPGSEDLRYLDWIGAEANVGGPNYTHILLRQEPSKAAILEEFLHGTQSRLGVIDRLGPRGLGSAETHVKDFMIRHQRMLGLADEDVAILKQLRDAGY